MADELGSWNDGKAKSAITGFVRSVTEEGDLFVSAADRVAAFDNDGTLWVEQPLPPQFGFLIETWMNEVKQNPALAKEQPYKALIEKDPQFFAALQVQVPDAVSAVMQAAGRSWEGTAPEDFDAQVREWLARSKQPKFGRRYDRLVYKPMLELFGYLRANDFRVFVCSGGGRDFMRVFAEDAWGIHKENVIGTAADYEYKDGKLLRANKPLGGVALGPGKPEHIFAQTGRMPLLAGGNGDVDIEMLAAARFALLIEHDDGEREVAYTSGADKALSAAKQHGWTVVSMKDDWAAIF